MSTLWPCLRPCLLHTCRLCSVHLVLGANTFIYRLLSGHQICFVSYIFIQRSILIFVKIKESNCGKHISQKMLLSITYHDILSTQIIKETKRLIEVEFSSPSLSNYLEKYQNSKVQYLHTYQLNFFEDSKHFYCLIHLFLKKLSVP